MFATMVTMMAAATAPAGSVQSAFDAADALAGKDDWAGALAGYDALAARVTSPASRAIVAMRRGEMLLQLDRADEAETLLRAALVAASGPSLAATRHTMRMLLARMNEEAFAYEAALADYRAAGDDAATDADRLAAMAGMARTGMFVDPAAAVVEADRAFGLAAADKATTPTLLAGYRTLKGRALLNAQRFAPAFDELLAATTALGGLTMKVDRNDIVARSDAAIAGLLAGRSEQARRILSRTGAGNRLAGFASSAVSRSPACGDGAADEPRRDDVAVVEFDIRDDGSVGRVHPIYLSRPQPQVARAFGEAVSEWSWHPEAVKAITPFFRSGVRVELRCSTTVERPQVNDQLAQDADAWFVARNLAPRPRTASAASDAVALRAELARREAADGASSPMLLPLLAAIVQNPVTTEDESRAAAERAVAIVRTANAPVPVATYFRLMEANFTGGRLKSSGWRWRRTGIIAALTALSRDPAVAGDARSQAAVRLQLAADQAYRGDDRRGAIATLNAIADDGRLGQRDQFRVAALARLATLQQAVGDRAAAQASFARSGLDGVQCSLADVAPRRTSAGTSSLDYPDGVLRWGFEGWVQTEYDIDAAGVPRNVRTTIAYPPFTFADTAEKAVGASRFEQTFRPAGSLGCGGLSTQVGFRIGG